jgi:carbon monoxide dehydrogenase subunit G
MTIVCGALEQLENKERLMTIVETSIFINRSPEDIFEFAAYSPEQIPEWFEGVESVEVDDAYPEIGGRIDVTYNAAGITLKTAGTVVELIPGQKYAARYEGMASGLQTWTYTPDGEGTLLSLHFDYEMAGGGIGKVVDKLVVERQNKKNFEQSLHNLKALLEG